MKNKTKIIIGIIIAAIVIPIGIYTISPLFINTEINEPLPTLLSSESPIGFEKFMAMTENEKLDAAKNMTVKEKDMIMKMAAEEQDTTINETMTININHSTQNTGLIGDFMGVNDGIHKQKVVRKILRLSDESQILKRLEDFRFEPMERTFILI